MVASGTRMSGPSEVTRASWKLTRKHHTTEGECDGRVGERKGRECVFWVELCFLTNQLILAEFLTRK